MLPLGSMTSLEEVGHWGRVLSFIAWPYSQPSLCFLVHGNVGKQPHAPATIAQAFCCHGGLYPSLQTGPQNKSLLYKGLFKAMKKVSNIASLHAITWGNNKGLASPFFTHGSDGISQKSPCSAHLDRASHFSFYPNTQLPNSNFQHSLQQLLPPHRNHS